TLMQYADSSWYHHTVLSNLLSSITSISIFFFFNDPATTEIYTLSLHDALPIFTIYRIGRTDVRPYHQHDHPPTSPPRPHPRRPRSEEHTSELQSPCNLVCRLLLEKKKKKITPTPSRYTPTTTTLSSSPSSIPAC